MCRIHIVFPFACSIYLSFIHHHHHHQHLPYICTECSKYIKLYKVFVVHILYTQNGVVHIIFMCKREINNISPFWMCHPKASVWWRRRRQQMRVYFVKPYTYTYANPNEYTKKLKKYFLRILYKLAYNASLMA